MASTATAGVRQRRRVIQRPRLLALLDESKTSVKTLIAPAGYGKTTLAEQWVQANGRRGGWYTARRSSTDVAALALGLARVSTSLVTGCDERLREHLRALSGSTAKVDVLAEILCEDLADWPSDGWLVIDDYQEICGIEEAEHLVGALAAAPVQLLIASRQRPSWVTARRILYDEVLELNQTTLAMDAHEAAQVLAGRSAPSAAGLVAVANGWPAVIGLAGVSNVELEDSEQLPGVALPVLRRGGVRVVGRRGRRPDWRLLRSRLFSTASWRASFSVPRALKSCAPRRSMSEFSSSGRVSSSCTRSHARSSRTGARSSALFPSPTACPRASSTTSSDTTGTPHSTSSPAIGLKKSLRILFSRRLTICLIPLVFRRSRLGAGSAASQVRAPLFARSIGNRSPARASPGGSVARRSGCEDDSEVKFRRSVLAGRAAHIASERRKRSSSTGERRRVRPRDSARRDALWGQLLCAIELELPKPPRRCELLLRVFHVLEH